MVGVIGALSSSVSCLGRRVVMRQISVKRAKSKHLIPKRHLQTCKDICRDEIPRVFDEVEKDTSQVVMRRFFGLLSLHLSYVYRHRTGVLQNMTIAEVEEARTNSSEKDEGFLINVKEHKTNRAFGAAKVYLWVVRQMAENTSRVEPLCRHH